MKKYLFVILLFVENSLAGTPVALAGRVGAGQVIGFAVNPHFRAIWYGTDRLTANAVFFGNLINPAALAPPPVANAETAGTAGERRNEE